MPSSSDVKEIRNIESNNFHKKKIDLIKIFSLAYKKTPSAKIKFDELRIKLPNMTREYTIKVKDYKNISQILYFLFANINKKPFTDKKYNPYTFELLWLILDTLENQPDRKAKFKKRVLFSNLRLYSENVLNLIQFGKYSFGIPKYKKFVFDVKGYNQAQLTIL